MPTTAMRATPSSGTTVLILAIVSLLIISPAVAFIGITPWSIKSNARRKCLASSMPTSIITTTTTATSIIQMAIGNNEKEKNALNPRDSLGRAIRGFQSSAFKDSIEAGDTVVCKLEVPSLGIYENTSYELRSIYAQYFDQESQRIIKEPLENLDVPIPAGCDRFITLYSPFHHDQPIVATPEDVGLVTVRSELSSAAWLAIPGFFWIFVASSFYSIYHERAGGSIMDAFLGR